MSSTIRQCTIAAIVMANGEKKRSLIDKTVKERTLIKLVNSLMAKLDKEENRGEKLVTQHGTHFRVQ